MHPGGHGREREDALHAKPPGVLDERPAEGVFAHGGLRLPDEDDQVVTAARVAPGEEPAARKPARPDEPVLDLDVLDVEDLSGRELGEQMHAELGHQVVAGADGHVPHPRPGRNQPGPVQFQLLRHRSSPPSVRPNSALSARLGMTPL